MALFLDIRNVLTAHFFCYRSSLSSCSTAAPTGDYQFRGGKEGEERKRRPEGTNQ